MLPFSLSLKDLISASLGQLLLFIFVCQLLKHVPVCTVQQIEYLITRRIKISQFVTMRHEFEFPQR